MDTKRRLVTGARSYAFTDKDSGEAIQGVTVHVLGADADPRGDQHGLPVLEFAADFKLSQVFEKYGAGIYDLHCIELPGAKGKAVSRIESVDFVGPFEHPLARGNGNGGKKSS